MRRTRIIACLLLVAMMLGMTGTAFAEGEKYTVSGPDAQGIIYVDNGDGETLGYHKDSGVTLLEDDGYAFKDLNKNGELDPYEDWRLTTAERAENLAGLMAGGGYEGIKSIAGLMLYSSHTSVNSETIIEDTMKALTDEYLRHVLVTGITSTDENVSAAEVGAKWSNNVQAYVEGLGYGIPANNSSDPRHAASSSNMEYAIGNSGAISLWPSSIGLAATFDPDTVLEFGQVASAEYRALGIATALSPQIDLATDPRWSRFSGTFGEDSALAVDMSRAYVDGFQSTYVFNNGKFGDDLGWGSDSVNGMVKHWPGGGAGEGGRDAHYNYGKFAVYPGDNFDEHLLPFTEGAFKLDGKTETATAVMPYYTISYNQDPSGDNVGNSYSRYIIQDLLRGEYKFEGVICTDWNIVYDVGSPYSFGGMCWGLENVDITDRFIRLLETGIDQFGGVNTIENIMKAYDKMITDSGKTSADKVMEEHAERLLTNIFNTGLFENPYLNVEKSVATVGNADFMEAGYETQRNSVVMIKNSGDVISAGGLDGKVYVANASDVGTSPSALATAAANKAMYEKYWGGKYVDDIANADYAVIVVNAPVSGGFDSSEIKNDTGNGYRPISLQYGSYTATTAREQSIAANPDVYFEDWEDTDWFGNPIDGIVYPGRNDTDNRSYKNKTTSDETNLKTLAKYNEITAAAKAADIPVVVYVRANNPMVFSEIEPAADAIVVGYSVQTQAAFDIISGKAEPSAMLPAQQPASMETVEAQYEDVAHDMECYVDADGNIYDFGFGLNYSGVIGVDTDDERWDKYVEEWAWTNPYADVEGQWYYTPIKVATYKGYVQGMDEDGKRVFKPEEEMTRAQFTQVLANVAKKAGEEISGTSTFKDVAEDKWYYDAIGWAQANDIIEGFPDGSFRPEDKMTREQMCKMIALYAEYMGIELTGDVNRTFTDAGLIQDWAKEYVELLTKAGVIEGYPEADGTYTIRPQNNASRAEVTKVAVGVFS